MSFFQIFLTFFVIVPSLVYAMEDESNKDKGKYILLIKKQEEIISEYKKRPQTHLNREQNVQVLFEAYMQKAAGHFHLGERDKQLKCYQEILGIEGLPKLTLARTHTNSAVVYLHLGRTLVASGHLQKAEELAPLQEIAKVIGHQIYSVFANIYDKTAQDLYLTHPEKALVYNLKALGIPHQEENWYAYTHLQLAVSYDRLLNSSESLNHALQTLSYKTLTPSEHDRALCYASLGSAGIGQYDQSIRYCEQIKSLKNLHQNERFLLHSTIGSCYFSKGEWNAGIEYRNKANVSLDSSSPEYLIAKYNLGIAYGESGNKDKEMEFYDEVLEVLKSNTFEKSWQEGLQSIRVSIETFYFMKAINEIEQVLRERVEQIPEAHKKDLQEKKLKKEQEKERRKENLRQQRIEAIRQVQREAAQKERKLDEEKKKKVEEEKRRLEERKNQPVSKSETLLEEQNSSTFPRYIPEQKPPKIKTRGVPQHQETLKEEKQEMSESLSPTLPKLGTRAQIVFDQIEDEDWSFTREDYTYYLEDLRCVKRENTGSHRIFQLPKTMIITLEKDGQTIQEHIFLADEDVKLGSAILPAWKGKQIPFYLRKQLRDLHIKIIKIYTEVTKAST